jgi:hypothetical protein
MALSPCGSLTFSIFGAAKTDHIVETMGEALAISQTAPIKAPAK